MIYEYLSNHIYCSLCMYIMMYMYMYMYTYIYIYKYIYIYIYILDTDERFPIAGADQIFGAHVRNVSGVSVGQDLTVEKNGSGN